MIFEPELETMPREELRALQLKRLRSLVAYVKERVLLYRERLENIEPQDIGSLDDLRHSLSRAKTISAIRTRSGCSPRRAVSSRASTPPPGRPASQPSSRTPATTSTSSPASPRAHLR